ncbi:FKBP-type peptidyl-prolyl cis-trans isomerase [Acetobacter lambici]|uniref:Peptidyl-prolyl cis-trans isomerase n=1 Tax=Acetobacter lambici TaxID=1332824 RepID=A0ABT1F3R7_9PROT|nr:FKBP-type peptidyl-prolyl cis-trans isomerase [Acetobacter lambici]MCP1243733.1 FKBP-type peptidyl-prolyl cis-trans isomerase [Acetobacter lambici]MCP1259835.1 FKBP-type peptidyl-prolyl cis-trans isomerase [Acetobacter lambici]NHO57976.1 FKBP-type peptidyl-prolyl cis-trans isomerase [Acetobacter lambici]
MSRRFSLVPCMLAASLAFSLTACGGHKAEEVELTPAQQMAKLRSEPGVTVLKDGLAYKVLESGPKDGEQPRKGDMMMLIYEGRLPDGSIFDGSEQHGNGAYMQMPLDGLVQGWMEALPMMHVGDTWMLYVPPELGYGHRSMGVIPSDSPLVFRIQLLGVEHTHNSP